MFSNVLRMQIIRSESEDMLNKQAEIYEALGVDVPTSSC